MPATRPSKQTPQPHARLLDSLPAKARTNNSFRASRRMPLLLCLGRRLVCSQPFLLHLYLFRIFKAGFQSDCQQTRGTARQMKEFFYETCFMISISHCFAVVKLFLSEPAPHHNSNRKGVKSCNAPFNHSSLIVGLTNASLRVFNRAAR